jgi:predicted dienelactone hydrolase
MTEQELKQLYGMTLGTYTLETASLELSVKDQGRSLPVRVAYPKEAGHFPLVIFSHGNWSDNTKYDRILEHWVSQGYIVLAPFHLDGGGMARGIFNSVRYGQLGLIEERRLDLVQVLDAVERLPVLLPALSGKVRSDKIAVAGHSFGAFSAQQMIGAGVYDEDADSWSYSRDNRVLAVLALSPPGPMFGVITEDSWNKVEGPMFLSTGTWDVNAQFFPRWELHRMAYDRAVAGNNWALVVEGADHYLGNLICRPEREVAPQHSALKMLNASSLAFLDWKLKDSKDAAVWFDGRQSLDELTQGFAQLTKR